MFSHDMIPSTSTPRSTCSSVQPASGTWGVTRVSLVHFMKVGRQ